MGNGAAALLVLATLALLAAGCGGGATPIPTPTIAPTTTPVPTPTPQATATPTPASGGDLVINITPSKDNTLYEDEAGSISNGSGEFLFAGRTGRRLIRRALVAFDVARHIPAGSTIESATLTLHMSRTSAGEETIELHRVLADWGEGTSDATSNEGRGTDSGPSDATWIHRFFDTDTWEKPGGDFSATVTSATSVADPADYTWGPSAQLTEDVQSWLDDPASDFGWMLTGDEDGVVTTKRFDSKENVIAADRPVLTVTYTPP